MVRVEEAVVEVAKSLEKPAMVASRPEAMVEVAVEVPTNAPAVNGLYDKALKSVTVEPRATEPPPPRPEPAVTVRAELTRLALVMTEAVEREPMERPPESERFEP